MPDELAAQLNAQVELDHNNDQIETPENLPVTGKRTAELVEMILKIFAWSAKTSLHYFDMLVILSLNWLKWKIVTLNLSDDIRKPV